MTSQLFQYHRKSLTLALALLATIASIPQALAEELPAPTGRVLLTISGNIGNTNAGDTAQFDLQMLESFDAMTFTTSTPWTDAPTEFSGVLMSDILEAVDAGSTVVNAAALDDYWFEFDTRDFESVPVIIAYKKDGKYMRIRDQGPLWIMFPFDDFPEHNDTRSKNTCVWHLLTMEVK